MTEPEEVGWRIRAGAGLLIHSPLNPALREAHRREDEREAQRAQLEAELRADRDLERAAELRRQGHELYSIGDTLARASFGMDRADKVEERREREAAEQLGQPPPHRPTRWELKREQQQREAEAIITPASKGDVGKLSAAISQIKSKLSGRSEQVSSGASRRTESPEEYEHNYGNSSIHYRNGGGYIVKGPY